MKINDKMIIKCNNAEEYSWLINELDKEDIFIFAIDPEHYLGKPERLNGREVNWDNKSYEKWFHDRRYFRIIPNFKLVHVMYQTEALRMKFMRNYSIIEAKELMKEKEIEDYCRYDIESTDSLTRLRTGVYKKEVKCLVRTDIIPWENCGIIGTNPYKEAITDLEGRMLKIGDYVKVIDIRNERNRIVTSIIVDIGNRLVPYCNKDYDGNKDILLIKVGEFPTYSNTVDAEKYVHIPLSKPDYVLAIGFGDKEASFVVMDQSKFDKQALAYYKAQYEDTLSKLEVLQKKYDDLEKTNKLLRYRIGKLKIYTNTAYGKMCMVNDSSVNKLSDKELINKNDIKDDSIIHCKSKEEAEWFFNIINDATSMEYFEIYDSCMGISYFRSYILSLFDTAPCIKNSGLYFKYTYRPLKVVLVDIDETDHPEDVLEASDLMKQEENKDEN